MVSDKIKVAVRVRPFNRREIELGTKCVVEVDEQQTILSNPSSRNVQIKPKTFAFDQCFWSFNENHPHYASQEKVFNTLGADILDNAFQGYNACIFAYGQTGSGKSFTMMGSEDNKGLIPRLCDALFERIKNQMDYNHKVEVSYMEIYNEKVHDLLDPKGNKQTLRVREHNILGPYVDGLSTLAVSSYEEISSLMAEGNKSRTVAATNMNSESSRSHAVFNIILTCSFTDNYSGITGEKASKMSLVDLAGSERAVKTGAVGERLKEGSNINKSLTTLGLVISKLADQSSGKAKDKFVPYRDSVLTWLLKDNLGGNSRTVMVATISPAADNYDETLSTLRYADRAKRIVNHAVVNEDPNARIIRDLREEVEQLRSQLKNASQPYDLHERLRESENLIREMTQTWEEKLRKTEKIHQERQQALEKMGISVQASGIKVQKDKYYLVNLNADPSLNELLVYYLKEKTVVGHPGSSIEPDIQLSGLGIMSHHCTLKIKRSDLLLDPVSGARTCVNGSVINDPMQLRHGDRILWGNNHFFRVNCPKSAYTNSLSSPVIEDRNLDYAFAREELTMNELSNDPIQSAMTALEKQHEDDKNNALEKQKQMYERQLQTLRSQMSPGTPYGPYTAFDPLGLGKYTPVGTPTVSVQSKIEKWAQDRDELFKKSLAKLREDIVRANGLVRETNFLAEEMGKQTEFKVTLQIPAANLSPNRKKGAFVSEPAVLVKRKNKNPQVWSMEKLENKLIDMREMYQERKEKGITMKDESPPKGSDPFHESQETHNLIGVANVFLDVLFHDVKLDYHVPIISQQGEVAGRLHVEVCRLEEISLDVSELEKETKENGHDGMDEGDEYFAGKQMKVKVIIKAATGLPPSLSNFVFCQYVFWGHPDSVVVPPVVNPDYPASRKGKDCMTFMFDHEEEFLVNVSEEFVEHCSEGALSIEVWGHRSAGFSSSKPGWEIDVYFLRSRNLADRWSELIRKIELWVEIHELNEFGDYAPVEITPRPDISTGGVFQLRQGQQRRVVITVKPVQNSGTLPIICEAITSVSVGGICSRCKLQKPLDSYQEEDLTLLREKWSNALMKRREYLDVQIQKIINKKDKTDQDVEREQSLIDQWVCLTEERNAVLIPTPGSGIPGSPAEWEPPPGMEKHLPVIFLDLNADDMSVPSNGENEIRIAGMNSILPKEHGSQSYNLPIVKYCEKEVCATAAWDSSIHDSSHLNKATSPNDRVYIILKACVRLSHPATMDLMLRKRLAINVYKKQSITERIKKKIARQDCPLSVGVTYEIVSNIPKASEDPEKRETLALMAASGEDASTSDGESYIEKYTKGVSAVESILMLDRLRQEVAVKELLAAQGKSLRKTSSVPNITNQVPRIEPFPSKLENQNRADSACELSSQLPSDAVDFRQRSNSLSKDNGSASSAVSPVGSPFGIARPTFLNLSFNLNYQYRQATLGLSSPLSGITTPSTKMMKPMTTVMEEQSLKALPNGDMDDQTDEIVRHRQQSSRKLNESNDELNELHAYPYENGHEVPEKSMRTLGTSDSVGELQTKVGTPSIMSSGYGSQILSTTPTSSEDSISLHSGHDDTKEREDIMDNATTISDENQNPDLQNMKAMKSNDLYGTSPQDGDLYNGISEMKFPSWLTVGESIMISPYNKTGVVAYLGPTNFSPGPWAGIELDTPTGKNDGVVNGVRYFECKPRFGIFVRPDKLVVDSRGRTMRLARINNNNSAPNEPRRNKNREGTLVNDGSSQKGGMIGIHSSKSRSRSRDQKTVRNRK